MYTDIEAIKTICMYFHIAAAVLGCIFNVVLIYLAVFKSPKAIATYSILILNVAITDLLDCITDFFLQQRQIPAGATLAYTSHGLCTYFGPHVCFAIYSVNIHFISHGLWSLLLGFAYRYYVLFHQIPTRKRMILVVFIVYIPSLTQMIIFMWGNDDSEELKRILTDWFPNYDFRNETVTGTISIFSFPTLFTSIHMSCPIVPIYITIIILRKKIINKLTENSKAMTIKTKQLHSQLLRALTYQALIPAFYSISILSYTICQFVYSHPIFEYTTFCGFLFMPIFSPLSCIIFINVYKINVLSWFYRMIGKRIPERWTPILNPSSKVAPTGPMSYVIQGTSLERNTTKIY